MMTTYILSCDIHLICASKLATLFRQEFECDVLIEVAYLLLPLVAATPPELVLPFPQSLGRLQTLDV